MQLKIVLKLIRPEYEFGDGRAVGAVRGIFRTIVSHGGDEGSGGGVTGSFRRDFPCAA